MAKKPDYLEDEVYQRPILRLDPAGSIAIKRDVHNFEIDADAIPFAQAFHTAMHQPQAEFGLVRVVRTRAETGTPFALNERFQGQYQIDEALVRDHRSGFVGWLEKVAAKTLDALHLEGLLDTIEDKLASDYGVITSFDLTSATLPTMTYEYLEGSPIAGSSTFQVQQLAPGRCRFTQIFTYQEQHLDFLFFFSTQGLKLHDQVVYAQVETTAKALGVAFRNLDMPNEYVAP
jgi:hypothetical protein